MQTFLMKKKWLYVVEEVIVTGEIRLDLLNESLIENAIFYANFKNIDTRWKSR